MARAKKRSRRGRKRKTTRRARKTPRKVPKKRRVARARSKGRGCARVCKEGFELVRRHPLTGKAYKGRAFKCTKVSYHGDRAVTRTVMPKIVCPPRKGRKPKRGKVYSADSWIKRALKNKH